MTRTSAIGCIAVAMAAAVAGETSTDAIPPAEEILANPLDDAAYSSNRRCLSVGRYRQVDILNSQTLVFRGRGNRAWVNVLPRRCVGLRRDMILAIERRGPRICSRDQFRAMPRVGAAVGTAFCSLGMFRPVDADNLGAIEGALEARHDNKVVTDTVRSGESVPQSR